MDGEKTNYSEACRMSALAAQMPKEGPNTPVNERKVRKMVESEEDDFIW